MLPPSDQTMLCSLVHSLVAGNTLNMYFSSCEISKVPSEFTSQFLMETWLVPAGDTVSQLSQAEIDQFTPLQLYLQLFCLVVNLVGANWT